MKTQHAHSLDQTFKARVFQAVAQLPGKNREVVVLSYIHGLEPEAIADMLDVSPEEVAARLRAARAQLEDEMLAMVQDILRANYREHMWQDVMREIEERGICCK